MRIIGISYGNHFPSFIIQMSNFTPLESPAIYGGDDISKVSIPYRKGGIKAPSFLTGFTLFNIPC